MGTKYKNFSQSLLWLGAAISISEILTGALLAPLGLKKGIFAILIGHIIGCGVLYFAGLIGAKSKLSAIESTRISFGKYGSYIFSVLNILQLVGWTAVMIINGAKALNVVTQSYINMGSETFWCIAIALLLAGWVLMGFKNLDKINVFAVSTLFILTLILGFIIFTSGTNFTQDVKQTLTFGAAIELNVIMPISWVPLISDYTRNVEHPKKGTAFSVGGYFIGSVLMYIIGLGASLFAGTPDISVILMAVGLPFIALAIISFSTVTTAFLDVYSAGVSFASLSKKASEKTASLVVCVLGLVMAITIPTTQYEPFLYLIGSVFAPLFAIVLTDYFILKNDKFVPAKLFDLKNSIIWVVGVILYRIFMNIDTPFGSTLPVMIVVGIICFAVNLTVLEKKNV